MRVRVTEREVANKSPLLIRIEAIGSLWALTSANSKIVMKEHSSNMAKAIRERFFLFNILRHLPHIESETVYMDYEISLQKKPAS